MPLGDARPAVEASAGGEDPPAQGSAAACERAAAAYREGQRSLLREALVALAAYGAAEAEERGGLAVCGDKRKHDERHLATSRESNLCKS